MIPKLIKPPFALAGTAASRLAPAGLRAVHEVHDVPDADEPAPGLAPTCVDGCAQHAADAAAARRGRLRLAQLDPHLYCSVIGTCLSSAELRKLMARHIRVDGMDELQIHHEAVALASQGGAVAKSLSKALDHRHEAAVQRFAHARGPQALRQLWDEALAQGAVPGAYWALLSHRDATLELRQQVFGQVHMLSHLAGASLRADLRRQGALETQNAELRERLDEQGRRSRELLEQRDRTLADLQQELREALLQLERKAAAAPPAQPGHGLGAPAEPVAAQIALHTERRERAEQAAQVASAELARLKGSLEEFYRHTEILQRELAAAEGQLRCASDPRATAQLQKELEGRRVLYVGGRPSSTPAIRDLVARHGGHLRHHDGGLEERKGLLAAAVAWAQIVVFPVDCVDHDSAGNLKRLCARLDIAFVALRTASVASFAAGIAQRWGVDRDNGPWNQPSCQKHG
jgi:hypothetical protein